MLQGCYYRCPISIEEGDFQNPRFFVLGQLRDYDPLSGMARVMLHDLLGSRPYYGKLLLQTKFRAPSLKRCAAVRNGAANTPDGPGIIMSRIKPASSDEPCSYYVRIHDGRHFKYPETELQIEYSQMDYSPIEQLLNYEFHHPTWFLNRQKVSRNVHLVDNAPYGFRVLAGCRAYLLPHQVTTIARCLETYPIRYMLADEVGLGKTIEACSILKILASENRYLRTLIIAPATLVGQWQSELRYKYNLKAELSSPKASICLLPLDKVDVATEVTAASWDLLIVDETHRALTHDSWYQQLLSLSRAIKHVLLLSATPIQDRREEYRRLLALLSPEQYEAMPSEEFAALIAKQKTVQQAANQHLLRMSRYDEYRDIISEGLRQLSGGLNDKTLLGLVAGIDLDSEDGGRDAASKALAYVCENYRVERKVIRNRRRLLSESMAKRTLVEVSYAPSSADDMYNETGVIQSTLAFLSSECTSSEDYFATKALPILNSLFSSPWALADTLESLRIEDADLVHSTQIWMEQAEAEHRSFKRALDQDPDLIKGRLLWALNYIDQETEIASNPECKIVVFTQFCATLREFLKLFNRRFLKRGIRAMGFGKHMSRKALDDSVYAFQNDPNCRVIVCDEIGGEGRNFQNAAQILHLDLPWSANAIEQRIGRLDRLGRNPTADVISVVFFAKGTLEEQLFRIWSEGMDLFQQSLSGLEIIAGDLNRLVSRAVMSDFWRGLDRALDDILDKSRIMKEAVEDEQLFDIGATLYRPLSQCVETVLRLYAKEEDNLFAEAMLGWSGQAGLEAEKTPLGLIEFKESRFSPRAALQSLFVPPKWRSYDSSSIVRRERKILGSFDRALAALREDVLFFAPGDLVYDAIISNAMGCSRGRCSAIRTPGLFNYDGLVFLFNIQPDSVYLLEKGIAPQVLSQFRAFLPLEQICVTTPITHSSQGISEEQVLRVLRSIKFFDHLGQRTDGRTHPSPLSQLKKQLSPGDWEYLVRKCYRTAFAEGRRRLKEQSDMESARAEMLRIINGSLAECLYFGKETSVVEDKRIILTAVFNALNRATLVLDSVCYLRVRNDE